MQELELPVEATKSASGLHAARSLIVIISRDGQARIIDKPDSSSKGTYKRGNAGTAKIRLKSDELAVHVKLILNPRGHVRGRVTVYSPSGEPLLTAVVRRRKIRRVSGDSSYAWAVENALKIIKLDKFIRRLNWRTGEV